MDKDNIKKVITGLYDIAQELEDLEDRIYELMDIAHDENLEYLRSELDTIRSMSTSSYLEQMETAGRARTARMMRVMATEKLSFEDDNSPFDTLVWSVLGAAELMSAYGMLAGIYDPEGDEDQTLHDLLGDE